METLVRNHLDKMYLNIYFSNRPRELASTDLQDVENSTNQRFVKYDNLLDVDTDNVFNFKYKLRENPTVEKWINHVEFNWGFWRAQDNIKLFNYNNYQSPSWQLIRQARIEMNDLIDEVKENNWFEVDENLKLDIDDKQNPQLDKLNELHFIFEDNLIEYNKTHEKDVVITPLFRALESMNNLVHICEKWDGNENPTVFNVFRMIEHAELQKLSMEDSDYNRMEVYNFGHIEIDFGTIGKDLGTCYHTNDVELVKRQEIKQQEWIRPFLAQKFQMPKICKPLEIDWKNGPYYDWCEENKVQDYGYDYTEPKYNLGRVILGDWIASDEYDVAGVQQILSDFPTFEDIRITDE